MVAITVILAAVIASFVLGLGSSADEVQPNTSFDIDFEQDNEDGNDVLGITVTSGDSVDTNELWLRGDLEPANDSMDATWQALADENDPGDDSATLASDSGPDA